MKFVQSPKVLLASLPLKSPFFSYKKHYIDLLFWVCTSFTRLPPGGDTVRWRNFVF